MTTATTQSTPVPEAPTLRLLPKTGSSSHRGDGRAQVRVLSGPPPSERPVLVVGSHARACAEVQRDLTMTMPHGATFEQARTVWEMIMRAPGASVVMLCGELEDVPAEALLQLLAQKNPDVPVVCLEDPPALPAVPSSSVVRAAVR